MKERDVLKMLIHVGNGMFALRQGEQGQQPSTPDLLRHAALARHSRHSASELQVGELVTST